MKILNNFVINGKHKFGIVRIYDNKLQMKGENYIFMETRADRIYEIIKQNGGRLTIKQIMNFLYKYDVEKGLRLKYDAVGATIRADNRTRAMQGKAQRFITFSDGTEERGYVSVNKDTKASRRKTDILANSQVQIPALLEERNEKTKTELREEIRKLTWQQFEEAFLESVLEALGFKNVVLTKKTRDGGKDAICAYQKALVRSQALVSAKHWKTRNVSVSEIQRMRGITGEFDSAIIITSAKFSKDAVLEAEKVHNQRSVLLVDMDYLVEICFTNKIGIKRIEIPDLYMIDDSFWKANKEYIKAI